MQTSGVVISYPYDTGPGRVCKEELLEKPKKLIWWLVSTNFEQPIEDTNSTRPWTRKNEFITQFNKPPTIIDKIFLHDKDPYELKHQYS